jgi:uncharacterized lipoprotein YddW (UPF0748 family)
MRPARFASTLLMAVFLTAGSPTRGDLTADQTPFSSYRGLWVSRFEFQNTAASVDQVFANAQALGFTDVMFQVRGAADAYYTPPVVDGDYLEHKVSSFDALGRAVEQGKARGIRVHAWINTVPLFSGSTLPTDEPGNPYVINTNPEFWIRDSTNTPQPLNASYVIANPTMPEVKQHLADVVAGIASRYDVDGVHLDYIRFFQDSSVGAIQYPTDPASVARFQAVPGNAGKTPTTNKADYQAWMADNVTELVSLLRDTVKATRPDAQLTASVWRNATIGTNSYQQAWQTWIDQGLVDAVMPMIYRKGFGSGGLGLSSDSGNIYRNDVTAALNWSGTAGVMPGLGPYMQDDATTAYGNTLAQLNYARDQGANGVQMFSYRDLVGTGAVDREIQRAWLDFVAATAGPAPITPLATFEVDEGPFRTAPSFSGSNRNVSSVSTADRMQADAHGGTGAQLLTINTTASGDFFLRHLAGVGTPGAPASNIELASIGAVGLWLKTTTTDLEVALAVDDNAANTATEQGYFQNVAADGEWHYYEWMLDDPSHWSAWSGSGANGSVAARFTLDSIQFRGSSNVNVLTLDDVVYDPAAVAPNQWTLDPVKRPDVTDVRWHDSGNWQGGVPNGVGATANFLRRAGGDQVVTVATPTTVGSLTFDNDQRYTLAGPGPITLDATGGPASLTVRNRGDHVIAADLSAVDDLSIAIDTGAMLDLAGGFSLAAGQTATRTGSGELVLQGRQIHGAGSRLEMQGGFTRVLTDLGGKAPPMLKATGSETLVELAVSQRLANLEVAEAAAVIMSASGRPTTATESLTIDGGRIDIGTGAIQVAPGGIAADDLRAAIIAGRNGGEWNGAQGIFSTAAAAAGGPRAVGYRFQADGSAAVSFAAPGDVDLSGDVTVFDLIHISSAANYGSGTAGVWSTGDFNYDGLVNAFDLVMINGSGVYGRGNYLPISSSAAAIAPVPEPMGWTVGAMAAAMAVATAIRRTAGRKTPPRSEPQ